LTLLFVTTTFPVANSCVDATGRPIVI